jgi:hypothetical protein
MRYHPKGTAYRKNQDMHFTAKPQRIRASKVFYLKQGEKMVQRSALYIVEFKIHTELLTLSAFKFILPIDAYIFVFFSSSIDKYETVFKAVFDAPTFNSSFSPVPTTFNTPFLMYKFL